MKAGNKVNRPFALVVRENHPRRAKKDKTQPRSRFLHVDRAITKTTSRSEVGLHGSHPVGKWAGREFIQSNGNVRVFVGVVCVQLCSIRVFLFS